MAAIAKQAFARGSKKIFLPFFIWQAIVSALCFYMGLFFAIWSRVDKSTAFYYDFKLGWKISF
jgi:hypothetical protein